MDYLTQIYGSAGTILLDGRDERLMVAKAGEPFQDMTAIMSEALGRPVRSSHPGRESGSIVTSAAMNGFPSPTTNA